jgi:hypothetical protein
MPGRLGPGALEEVAMNARKQALVIGALALLSATALIAKPAAAYQMPGFGRMFPIDIVTERTWLPRKAPADDARARMAGIVQARRTAVGAALAKRAAQN